MNYKEVFGALPHINEIWITNDGNFHLHPHNGGQKITRSEAFKPLKEEKEESELEKIEVKKVKTPKTT